MKLMPVVKVIQSSIAVSVHFHQLETTIVLVGKKLMKLTYVITIVYVELHMQLQQMIYNIRNLI